MSSMKCVLCSEVSSSIETAGYYHCGSCDLRFLDPALRLSVHEEKERYLKHNNDVSDVGYQAFVQPLVNAVCEKLPLSAKGLDFGSGAAPIVSHLLSKRGYHLEKYDPHFATDKSVLKEATYDFVVACEVVEHFHEPLKEFERMHALLKLGDGLDNWKTQIRKGYLELCILLLIQKHKRLYGFELLDKLSKCNLSLKEGTLYPMLNRMAVEKTLQAVWETENVKGHPRKFYSITKDGAKLLEEMKSEFENMVDIFKSTQK